MMHDLVVRNGRIVDGTGAPAFAGDVAVTDGRITEVGAVDGAARRTIDADGIRLGDARWSSTSTPCLRRPELMWDPGP